MLYNFCISVYLTCLCQYMSRYNVFNWIYKNMPVYAIFYVYIPVYTRIYSYIQIFKTYLKICITAGFKPVISCILFAGITTALRASTRRYCSSLDPLLFRVTWRLVSDVGRGTRCAARTGHDVACPGLYLVLARAAAACQ